MCDICGRMLCPPSCPSYDGRDAERGMSLGRCAECGAFLYEDSDFFVDGYKLICTECRARATEPRAIGKEGSVKDFFGYIYRKEKNDRRDG